MTDEPREPAMWPERPNVYVPDLLEQLAQAEADGSQMAAEIVRLRDLLHQYDAVVRHALALTLDYGRPSCAAGYRASNELSNLCRDVLAAGKAVMS